MHSALFSHESDDWATPDHIYHFYIDNGYFDPCPLRCSSFDGLLIDWPSKVFVNPPFSDILSWVRKALLEYEQGKEIVMLLPVRTDTKWFHELIEVRPILSFFKGRLHFGGSKNSAPFPCMLVLLDKKLPNFGFYSQAFLNARVARHITRAQNGQEN